MNSSLGLSDIFAGLAFLLSAYATWKTIQFNSQQKSLMETQERLNQRLLEREDADSTTEKRADLGATFVKLGSSKYRLKIWNRGRAAARNVSIEFPEGNDCFIDSEIGDKFPLEALDTHQSVELVAAVHSGTKSKHTIKLCWADDFSSSNEKVVYPTL